jgi:hypothetical protein
LTKRAIGKLTVEGTPENVSTIVKTVLPLIGISFAGEKVVSEKPLVSEIYAMRAPSWKSFGESIEIRLCEIAQGQTLIEAKSECLASQLIFDYGRNKKNLESLFGELAKRLKTMAPANLEEKRWGTDRQKE